MGERTFYQLVPDRKGVVWDLLLYVPTVVILALIALKLWYGTNPEWAYILFFMASFFFIAGANRILKTRLMLVGSSPTALEIGTGRLRIALRNGEQIDLVKDLRYYADTQGKSFALTGTDVLDRRRQYIFHRGNFVNEIELADISGRLRVYQ